MIIFYFFAPQVDCEIDTGIPLPVTITDSECKEARPKRESLYVPDEDSHESEDDVNYVQDESLKQLNRFLQVRDISPVRHTLSLPWNSAQSRTKRRYLRKAEQCVSAVMEVLAPEDSNCLWTELCEREVNRRTTDGKSWKDVELLQAFAESYLNAQHWGTRRQILSILADKLSFKEVQEFIPTLTNYRYNIATPHPASWKGRTDSSARKQKNES